MCNSFYIVCTIVLIRLITVLFSYSALGCKSVLINQSINQKPSSKAKICKSGLSHLYSLHCISEIVWRLATIMWKGPKWLWLCIWSRSGELPSSNSEVYETRMCISGIYQYSGLFHYYSLGGDIARPSMLHNRLCHAFPISDFDSLAEMLYSVAYSSSKFSLRVW